MRLEKTSAGRTARHSIKIYRSKTHVLNDGWPAIDSLEPTLAAARSILLHKTRETRFTDVFVSSIYEASVSGPRCCIFTELLLLTSNRTRLENRRRTEGERFRKNEHLSVLCGVYKSIETYLCIDSKTERLVHHKQRISKEY